jgi:hypothetical protein
MAAWQPCGGRWGAAAPESRVNSALGFGTRERWEHLSLVLYFLQVREQSRSRKTCAEGPSRSQIHPSGRVAQLAEHSALNRQVEGSIPSASTSFPEQSHRRGPSPSTPLRVGISPAGSRSADARKAAQVRFLPRPPFRFRPRPFLRACILPRFSGRIAFAVS